MLEVATQHPVIGPASWIVSTVAVTAAFWTCFGACVEAPPPPDTPQPRVIASWDPLACGEPHRVALELADDRGAPVASSVPCNAGSITLDVPHMGLYRGRLYAWLLGAPSRAIAPVELDVEQEVVQWTVGAPP